MHNRRHFIQQSALAAGSLLVGQKLYANEGIGLRKLTILHTNDTHSRMDPFPMDGSRNAGGGGVAARAALIKKIRSEETNVLLLDAGDIFQGTPYFNLYKGEPEIKAMTAMGYDATTIGNHDFDAGVDNLAMQLKSHASFPMIVSNYNFSGTAMEGISMPYKIFNKDGIKIGVFGLGIQLDGLVPQALYRSTQYLDPVSTANKTAALLEQKDCDLVICLSHLGYTYESNRIADKILAKETRGIDLIIGGHTHTFMEKPDVIQNKDGKDVIINQVGWAGLQLGRLDYIFSKEKNKNLVNTMPITITKKTDQ